MGKAFSLIYKIFLKPNSTEEVNKENIIRQCTQIFKHISKVISPLVIFLDDLHWSDESSINLLFHLSRNISDDRIMILGAYRPSDIEAKDHPLKKALTGMCRYDLCKKINLDFLSIAHIRQFVNLQLNPNRLSEEFINYLYITTNGNPLFFTEFLKLLLVQEKIIRENEIWILKGELKDINTPNKVEEVIRERVRLLKQEIQQALQYASVEGKKFNSIILAKLLNWEELALLREFRILEKVHKLIEVLKKEKIIVQNGQEYQFVHSLIQKTLYEELDIRTKQILHRKIGEILEEENKDKLDMVIAELAEHFERGCEFEKAVKYRLKAAANAKGIQAFSEAIFHCNKGIEMTDSICSNRLKISLKLNLMVIMAHATAIAGNFEKAISLFKSILDLVENNNNIEYLEWIDRGWVDYFLHQTFLSNQYMSFVIPMFSCKQLGILLHKIGNSVEAEKYFSKILDNYQNLDTVNIARSLLSIERCGSRDINTRIEILKNGLITCNQKKDKFLPLAQCIISRELGKLYRMIGDYEKARINYQNAIDIHKQNNDSALRDDYSENWHWKQIEPFCIEGLGDIYKETGEWEKALEHYRKVRELKKSIGDVMGDSGLLLVISDTNFLLGNYHQAIKDYEESLKIAKITYDAILLSGILSTGGKCYLEICDFKNAFQCEQKRLQIAQNIMDDKTKGSVLAHKSNIALVQGNLSEAEPT